MFAEKPGLAVLVQVCWPASIAIYLTFAFSRGGPRRLWRDAAAVPGSALVIQALGFRRVPSVVRAVAGAVVGIYSTLMGVWIT